MRRYPSALLIAGLVAISLASFADSTVDRHSQDVEAVRAAVLDYVEGIYEATPERIERSVDPRLAKLGWTQNAQGDFREHPLTYERLITDVRRFQREGRPPVDGPKEITIYEVLDKTASVKVTAKWGVDYLHLAKLDGQWKILNVLWQSHPRE